MLHGGSKILEIIERLAEREMQRRHPTPGQTAGKLRLYAGSVPRSIYSATRRRASFVELCG